MTVVQKATFRDTAAEVIADLYREYPAIREQCRYRHSMLQVAGAIYRELVRSTGHEHISDITDDLVDCAFLNEMARVFAGWPATDDFVRPSLFFPISDVLRNEFHRLSLGDPSSGQDYSKYTFLDTPLPILVMDANRDVVYASPSMMLVCSALSERAIDLCSEKSADYGRFVHDDDKAGLATDRMLMLNDLDVWQDKMYRTKWSHPDTIHLHIGTKWYDGDGQYIGELFVFELLHIGRVNNRDLTKYLHSYEYAVQPTPVSHVVDHAHARA